MASLPKPLIAVLVATVAVAALWTAVLKKTITGGGSGGSQTPATYQSAIAKAHQAVATSDAASVAHGGTVVQSTPSPGSATTASQPAKPAAAPATNPVATSAATRAKPAAHAAKAAPSATSPGAVLKAISEHKVVALLFFNPSAADDVAVKQELAGIPSHGGQVAKFAAPVTQLSNYSAVTSRVPVTESPTLLVIDKQGETTTLVGFADQLEIAQRIADALSVK